MNARKTYASWFRLPASEDRILRHGGVTSETIGSGRRANNAVDGSVHIAQRGDTFASSN
jgi:hypothetical protein